MILWKHQIANAERLLWLLTHRMTGVDCSETGTGKTVTSSEVIRRFNLEFVIVCPKSVRSHWQYWVDEFELGHLCLGIFGWEEMRMGKHPRLYDGRQWFKGRAAHRHLVVFDEAHRGKSPKTLNSGMIRSASQAGVYLLLLSATLIQSTLDLLGLAFPLKLVAHPRYAFEFARKFGARIHPRFKGYDDNSSLEQQRQLALLLDKIRVRTKREDIAKIIPVLTQSDLVDSTRVEAIRGEYERLDIQVRELERLGADTAQILTARLRGRQAIELLKVPIFVEQALEHLENGFKVALFFNFSASIREAAAMFDAKVGVIEGSTNFSDRDILLKEFNSPSADLRVLVLNLSCGGEGINLQDTHGGYPRVSLLSPPESASALIQACGRIGGRIGAESVGLNRILFVAHTVEAEVFRNVTHKINRLETLNDSDLQWKTLMVLAP